MSVEVGLERQPAVLGEEREVPEALDGVVTTPRVAITNMATAADALVFIPGRATAVRREAGP
jgi:hypothetical protein